MPNIFRHIQFVKTPIWHIEYYKYDVFNKPNTLFGKLNTSFLSITIMLFCFWRNEYAKDGVFTMPFFFWHNQFYSCGTNLTYVVSICRFELFETSTMAAEVLPSIIPFDQKEGLTIGIPYNY